MISILKNRYMEYTGIVREGFSEKLMKGHLAEIWLFKIIGCVYRGRGQSRKEEHVASLLLKGKVTH